MYSIQAYTSVRRENAQKEGTPRAARAAAGSVANFTYAPAIPGRVCWLIINLVTQFLFYGALATAGRSLTLAALVLGLAVPRRYAIRRLFNARIAPGTRQSCAQSWFEVGVDTVLAILIASLLQRPGGAAAT
jgi:hypothetical protein